MEDVATLPSNTLKRRRNDDEDEFDELDELGTSKKWDDPDLLEEMGVSKLGSDSSSSDEVCQQFSVGRLGPDNLSTFL